MLEKEEEIRAHSFVPYTYNIFKTLCMYSFFFCSSEFFRIFRSCFDKMQAIHLEFAIIKILLFYKMYSRSLFVLERLREYIKQKDAALYLVYLKNTLERV